MKKGIPVFLIARMQGHFYPEKYSIGFFSKNISYWNWNIFGIANDKEHVWECIRNLVNSFGDVEFFVTDEKLLLTPSFELISELEKDKKLIRLNYKKGELI